MIICRDCAGEANGSSRLQTKAASNRSVCHHRLLGQREREKRNGKGCIYDKQMNLLLPCIGLQIYQVFPYFMFFCRFTLLLFLLILVKLPTRRAGAAVNPANTKPLHPIWRDRLVARRCVRPASPFCLFSLFFCLFTSL